MRYFIVGLFLMCFYISNSQSYKVSGTVYTSEGNILPFASVLVVENAVGASANNNGVYALTLPKGKYTLRCQHVGFSGQDVVIDLDRDKEINFVLKIQELTMEKVEVKAGGEDPAYRIMREAIKKRKDYVSNARPFQVDRYSKDVLKLVSMPDKVFGQKVDPKEMQESGFDSLGRGILYLSEAMSKISASPPNKFKMEVLQSRVSGSDQFGFSFPISISLYSNNVIIFSEKFNPRGFISPIAEGAMNYYKYKLLGTFFEGDNMIYSIRLTPKRDYEPLFNGVINIVDGSWRIHSADVYLTKKSQLEMVDSLKMQQLYNMNDSDSTWHLRNQVLEVRGKILGIEIGGAFQNVYSNYNYSPNYTKKSFDNVLIAYDTGVTNKPKEWWETARPVPLSEEEQKDYVVKDSLFSIDSAWMRSDAYIDSMRKWQGKIKPKKILFPGLHRKHYSKHNPFEWGIEPLLININYNTVEGLNFNFIPYWMKNSKSSSFLIEPYIRYGFNNGHLNPALTIAYSTKSFKVGERYKNYSFAMSGGKRVTQFNKDEPVQELNNTISSLLWGQNFMKIYESYYGTFSVNKAWENGLQFTITGTYEDRLPLNNTTDFSFVRDKKKKFTDNYPVDFLPAEFVQHQAVVLRAKISFQPYKKYIQLPKEKIAIGSSWPTFNFIYEKGIKDVLNSDVDFDKWKMYMVGKKNMRIAGEVVYKIGAAGFLNAASVPVQDYWHLMGNESNTLTNMVNSFQLANYYELSNKHESFGFAHIDYHLNGLLSNKVPFLKKYNIFFVTGTNVMYAGSNNNYVEAYFGLENILKIFRVDFIAGFENGSKPTGAVKFGFGGIFANRFGGKPIPKRTRGNLGVFL